MVPKKHNLLPLHSVWYLGIRMVYCFPLAKCVQPPMLHCLTIDFQWLPWWIWIHSVQLPSWRYTWSVRLLRLPSLRWEGRLLFLPSHLLPTMLFDTQPAPKLLPNLIPKWFFRIFTVCGDEFSIMHFQASANDNLTIAILNDLPVARQLNQGSKKTKCHFFLRVSFRFQQYIRLPKSSASTFILHTWFCEVWFR